MYCDILNNDIRIAKIPLIFMIDINAITPSISKQEQTTYTKGFKFGVNGRDGVKVGRNIKLCLPFMML